MNLEETLGAIETTTSVDGLLHVMQKIAEQFGFASYNFIDVGEPHVEEPFWSGTTGARWESEYNSYGFVHADPTLSKARRTNTPFFWSELNISLRKGPKSGARSTMEAARDHGFEDGLVIPIHIVDRLGRPRSACIGFFWTEPKVPLTELKTDRFVDLHIEAIYWTQKAIDLVAVEFRKSHPIISQETSPELITPKERDVLSWSARGKTSSEAADIMNISDSTAKWHLKNALRKLDANTKTQAVTKAIYLGLIDI